MSLFPRSASQPYSNTDLDTSGGELRVERAHLEVTGGPDRGTRAMSVLGELSIGTAASNHLVLTDPTVSRHHCVLTATPDGFLIRDLDSGNGTLLGGTRIQSAFVDADASIQIGDTVIRFDTGEEAMGAAPAGEPPMSVAMRRLAARFEAVTGGDASVLIEGAPGSGERILAEAIHRASARAHRPFAVLDCRSVPSTQLEAELFGRGDEPGLVEAAAGGTLFLTEIGEMPLELQGRLLRLLDVRQIRRVGSVLPVAVDVRLIAASSTDLRREVNRKTFRSDLLDRLSVGRIEVPAERREEVAAGLSRLVSQADGHDAPIEIVTRPAAEEGGRGRMARGTDPAPIAAPMPEPQDFTVSFRDAKERAVGRWTAVYVRELLAKFDGNLSRAARTVAMDRNHLRDLLRKYVGPDER